MMNHYSMCLRIVGALFITAVLISTTYCSKPTHEDVYARLQKAAEQGDLDAQFDLGWLYFYGDGVPKDAFEGEKWLEKYAYVPKNATKAVEWWQKAAEQGNVDAQHELGWMYYHGKGVPSDETKAAEWYQKAAEQGNADAQFNLALMYDNGRGVRKNATKAVEWYQRAAEHQGHSTTASRLIGQIYYYGEGVPKNLTKASKWWQKAAEQGDAEAQNMLGLMYYNGKGVPKDVSKAVEWWLMAAMQGYRSAQFSIGLMYDEGEGVPKDDTKAVEWYQKAAAQGYAAAQNNLALMYFHGEGVSKDRVLAYAWSNLASTKSSELVEDVKNFRDKLETKLTSAERVEAQWLASNWKEGQILQRGGSEQTEPTLASGKQYKYSTGTGFVISKSGYALTNHHMVDDCNEVKITGREGTVKIVTADVVNDLALLQLSGEAKEFARLATNPNALRQGEDIVVFGYPLNSVLSSGGNLTPGVVSALTGLSNNTNQIQITAPIQPGSSGSPVLNKKGNIVGVISMRLSDAETLKATGSLPQNVNFAVNGQTMKAFLDHNKVSYKTESWFSFGSKNAADIAEDARKWTVIVECWK